MLVVHCEQLQLLNINLLQQRVKVDALDQTLNVAVQLLVLLRQVSVLDSQLLVAARQALQLDSLLLLQALKLRKFDLLTKQLLAVVRALVLNHLSILTQKLHRLLGANLLVEHVSSQVLLLFELLHHHLCLFVFELQAVLKSGDLLAFSLELKSLLISLSDAPALETVLHFEVFLVDLSFLSQDVQNLFVSVLLLTFKILDSRLSDQQIVVYLL